MTSETAKIKVEMLDNYLSHTCQDYGERDHEAMMMAIKALDQEPILDKIRAEIEESRWIDKDTRIVRNALASGLEKALEIIDKYKAEGEEE